MEKLNLKYTLEETEKLYLDYINNFLTIERFAEYYNISIDDANAIINKHKVIQESPHAV